MHRVPLGLLVAAFLLALAASAPALAHQFAPALLEIDEVSADEAAVEQPAVRVQGSQLRPVLPVECEGLGDPEVKEAPGYEAPGYAPAGGCGVREA